MEIKLSELVNLVSEQVDPECLQSETWVVGLADIEADTGQWIASRKNFELPKSSKFRFNAGDILFGKLRPELRKCVVAPQPGVCSTDIIVLRPIDTNDTWYLNLMLRSDMLISQVRRRTVGASLPRVRPNDLLDCSLPRSDSNSRRMRGSQAKLASDLREAIREMDVTLLTIERRLQLPE